MVQRVDQLFVLILRPQTKKGTHGATPISRQQANFPPRKIKNRPRTLDILFLFSIDRYFFLMFQKRLSLAKNGGGAPKFTLSRMHLEG